MLESLFHKVAGWKPLVAASAKSGQCAHPTQNSEVPLLSIFKYFGS